MPFLKKKLGPINDRVFLKKNFIKKIIPQCIKNDPKKIITFQNIEKKKLPNNLFFTHTYQSEKKLANFFWLIF